MTKYLLDSDTAIELLRGRNPDVAAQLASKKREQVFLSTVTVSELLFGALRAKDSDRSVGICQQFCSSFHLLGLDYVSAERVAVLRADLEKRGQRIGAYDMLIAGIALAQHCVLVTHNVREFGRITELRIEDWVAQP